MQSLLNSNYFHWNFKVNVIFFSPCFAFLFHLFTTVKWKSDAMLLGQFDDVMAMNACWQVVTDDQY